MLWKKQSRKESLIQKMNKYTSLFRSVTTVEESKDLIMQLEELSGSLFSKKSKDVFDNLQLSIKNEVEIAIKEQDAEITDATKLQELLNSMIEYIQGLSVLSLTLAVSPTSKQLHEMSDWLERSTGKKILLNIMVDHTVIAGAKIQYNGVYKNYSL